MCNGLLSRYSSVISPVLTASCGNVLCGRSCKTVNGELSQVACLKKWLIQYSNPELEIFNLCNKRHISRVKKPKQTSILQWNQQPTTNKILLNMAKRYFLTCCFKWISHWSCPKKVIQNIFKSIILIYFGNCSRLHFGGLSPPCIQSVKDRTVRQLTILGLEISDWDGEETIHRETWTTINPGSKSSQRWPHLKGNWRIRRGLSCQLHNWWPVQRLWPASTGRVTHEDIGWTGPEAWLCKSKNSK